MERCILSLGIIVGCVICLISVGTYGKESAYLNPAEFSSDPLAKITSVTWKPDGTEMVTQFADPTTGMEFILIKDGCYQMGNTFKEGSSDEKPVHEVCVDNFYMGKFEVTQGEYRKIMGRNPSKSKKGKRYPVETVSWEDAQEFLQKLNRRTGKFFRLPTEAEWEYAARSGGRKEKYSGGGNVDSVAWYGKNWGGSTHRVGQKQANGLGLHDMSGNVWEWCQDRYAFDYYSKSSRNNPTGPSSGSYRVARGGSWNYGPSLVRAASRRRIQPWKRYANLGFRLASSLGQ